jgi:hypothetical protein
LIDREFELPSNAKTVDVGLLAGQVKRSVNAMASK